MHHSSDSDLQRLLRLPWTIVKEVTPEGDILLRVKEIPSAVGSGSTTDELVSDLWESLTESLRAYLHFGDQVPLPLGVSDSWVRLTPPLAASSGAFIVSPASAHTGTNAAVSK